MRLLLAAALLVAAQPALAQSAPAQSALPDSVRAMVEAAAKSGDKAKIDAVVAIAKETNKGAEGEIDRIVADISAAQAAEREAKLATAGFFENWTGSGQLGAAITTGNTEQKSFTAGLELKRDGLQWRHRANALFDIVDNEGGTDQQRILAGYQIDYKFSDRLYAWGRFEYEKNREAGIERRFAESAGLGWRAVSAERVTWDLEAGPALRQTRFVNGSENMVAVRGASRFLWNLSDTSAFTNDTAIFWDSAGSIANTTALTSKLFGSLSARLSVNLAWEQDPPFGLEKLDTTSRVTLVYTF
jgi:putative salt-induced outer membrane protein